MWLSILSWGSKLLPIMRSPKGLLSGLAVMACLLVFLYVGSLRGTIKDLEEEKLDLINTKAQITAFYQQCADANAQNLADIKLVSEANRLLAEKLQVSEKDRIQAIKEAVARAMRAEARLDDTIKKLEEERNETTDCQALSRIDMGAVCPAVTERLRQHALGPNADHQN